MLQVLGWILFVVVYGVFSYAMVLSPYLSGGWERLHDTWFGWQSFNVGMLALAAAIITFAGMNRIESVRIRRNARASKAMLVVSLTAIHAYCKECVATAMSCWSWIEGHTNGANLTVILSVPQLDPAHIDRIGECIVNFEDREADKLAKLLSKYQIQHARLKSLVDKIEEKSTSYAFSVDDADRKAMDALELQAMASMFYEYCRGNKDYIEQVQYPEDLNRMLKLMYSDDEEVQSVYDLIERYYPISGPAQFSDKLGSMFTKLSSLFLK